MVDTGADNVSRTAAALIALGSRESLERGGLGVLRLAEITGGDKGQLSRLLKTLDSHGLVERDDETRTYRLGWQVFVLASRVGDQRLLGLAPPLLARLVEQLGERANVSVLRGNEVLTVLSEASPRSVQSVDWVGRTVPSYCTSAGRALLFDHSRDDLTILFAGSEFGQHGPNAPRDVESLHRRLGASRARGFAVVDEEFEPDSIAVAAPVRNFAGRICAAVNVAAPKFRLGGTRRIAAVGTALKEVADEMSLRLGESPAAGGVRDGEQR
ncbi:MAG: IclR family transcriptional regulator [Pseudonocardiales bacterium]|nr:MAG: IclR family transcriptional regulator [Pseudonocardiales bacterium]